MNYIPKGNSTTQSDYDDATTTAKTPWFFVAFGGIFFLVFIFLIIHLVKLRRHHRQPQTDVETAGGVQKERINLQTLNEADPSQKYKEVKGLKKQTSWASAQSSSAEVCAICLEVLVDQDDVRRLKCKHVFHTSCIDSWLQKRHVDCPLCKSIFIPNRQVDPGPGVRQGSI
ncbi:hypothetical protein EDB81DRAFT_817873 [Dactylonectria macrodidyma]|uniref:RING-type domain-containing protein n=1 Tax=Dactylonectria macrodidyma TaxID=307937 RepID=A0A9P9DH07_9HYPO|nr:hypothetical protein EDB81DRAFT_817873 [Dactylonectria macrodidyma]